MRQVLITLMILVLTLPLGADEGKEKLEPLELVLLRDRYQKALDQATAPIHRSYRKQLESMKLDMTRRGKLEDALAIKTELEAFDEAQGKKKEAKVATYTRRPRKVENIAKEATVTTSSTYGRGLIGQQAIDGVKGVREAAWASDHEGPGAWIKLSWKTKKTISRVVLYDRVIDGAPIFDGKLVFSDGSEIKTGPLPNAGTAKEIKIHRPKKTTWVKFVVVTAKGRNVGLSEFEVYGY